MVALAFLQKLISFNDRWKKATFISLDWLLLVFYVLFTKSGCRPGTSSVPFIFKLPLKLSTLFCRCNDLLKNRDDSPSFLVTRLTAIRVLGTMYERLGRMTGRSYEETVQVLNKGLKNAESQARAETMIAFGENQYFTTYNLTSFMKKLSLQ